MSSFKQRLGNALDKQFNMSGSSSGTHGHHHNHYHNTHLSGNDTSVGNIYGGLGSSKKSINNMNTSKLGTTGTNVLSERVTRISEKINEIHVSTLPPHPIVNQILTYHLQHNIEKVKLGKLDEYERKVCTLEEKFDEAIDTSEKKFEIVDTQV